MTANRRARLGAASELASTSRRRKRFPRKRALAWLCLLAWTSAAAAEDGVFNAGNSQVTVVDGRPRKLSIVTTSPTQDEVRILGRMQTGDDCQTIRLPQYELVRAALHGVVCYRDERTTIKFANEPRPVSCVGREALGRVLYYRPSTGYVGADAFQYEIVGPAGVIAVADVAVALTPPRSVSDNSEPKPSAKAKSSWRFSLEVSGDPEPSPSAAASQQLGPIDRCPEAVK